MFLARLSNGTLKGGTAQLHCIQVRSFAVAAQAQPIASEKIAWNEALPYKKIPGPSKLQIVRDFMPGGKYHEMPFTEVHKKLLQEYGTLVKLPGMPLKDDIIITYKADDFKMIFRTEGVWPIRRGMDCFTYYRKEVRPDVFKNMGGLVAEHGETWQNLRTITNPVMLQPKTVRLYVRPIDEVAQEFIDIIRTKRDAKRELPANFGSFMNRWSIESIGCIALDTRLGLFDPTKPNADAEVIIKSVRDMMELMYHLEMLPSFWKLYKTPKFVKLMQTFDNMTNAILKYVDAAILRLEKSTPTADHEMGVLEKLLQIDRHAAVVMCYDMLMAGVDTTASFALVTLYLLAKNPEKQAKLREEMRTIMPARDTKLTPESMLNLPYLRACLKEAMRMMPVVAGNLRATGEDTVIQGYQVPKDVNVFMANQVLQQSDANFPKSAQFIPERWLKDSSPDECPSAKTANPFIYLPFGFGVRTCIGRRFAELEVQVLIARMIRQFNVEWHHEDMKIKTTMANVPTGDLKFRLHDIVD